MNELILNDLRVQFGLKPGRISPVTGGWLNLKWRVETDDGPLLVKQYSHERFNRRKLNDIEEALRRQIIAYSMGVPCPRVWQKDGQIVQHPSEDVSYMVMEFAQGRVETPETVTPAQMESLGEACARMHRAFSLLPVSGVKGYPLNCGRIMEDFHGAFSADGIPHDAAGAFGETVARLSPTVACVPDGFLSRLPRAIAHEDFTGDNMLFADESLSVIIDFDRNQYSFPLHDIGRILLSLALRDDEMDMVRVRAFMDGYSQHLPLTPENTADALRLTFVMEAPWWLKREYFSHPSPKAARFVKEICWLGERVLKGEL